MTAWLVLIDEELYRAQGVEPCVSELWSARPGVSHARLHGKQSGIEVYKTHKYHTCVSELWSARPGVSHARLHGEQSGIEVRFTVSLGPFKSESLGFPQ